MFNGAFWIIASAGSEVINHLGVSWIHAELRLGSDPEAGNEPSTFWLGKRRRNPRFLGAESKGGKS